MLEISSYNLKLGKGEDVCQDQHTIFKFKVLSDFSKKFKSLMLWEMK